MVADFVVAGPGVKGERSESRRDRSAAEALDAGPETTLLNQPGEAENPTTSRSELIMKVYLTVEEVAESLRVSVATVRWLRQEGRFAPAIKVGRRVVWDEAEVAAWMARNREPAA